MRREWGTVIFLLASAVCVAVGAGSWCVGFGVFFFGMFMVGEISHLDDL